jgi:hypothetical protein
MKAIGGADEIPGAHDGEKRAGQFGIHRNPRKIGNIDINRQ